MKQHVNIRIMRSHAHKKRILIFLSIFVCLMIACFQNLILHRRFSLIHSYPVWLKEIVWKKWSQWSQWNTYTHTHTLNDRTTPNTFIYMNRSGVNSWFYGNLKVYYLYSYCSHTKYDWCVSFLTCCPCSQQQCTHAHIWMYVKYVWCSHMTKAKKMYRWMYTYAPEYTWNMSSSSSSSLIACNNVIRIFICIACHVCQSYWPTETERYESTLIFLPLCAADAALCCVCPKF